MHLAPCHSLLPLHCLPLPIVGWSWAQGNTLAFAGLGASPSSGVGTLPRSPMAGTLALWRSIILEPLKPGQGIRALVIGHRRGVRVIRAAVMVGMDLGHDFSIRRLSKIEWIPSLGGEEVCHVFSGAVPLWESTAGLDVRLSEFPGLSCIGTKDVLVDLFEQVPLIVMPPQVEEAFIGGLEVFLVAERVWAPHHRSSQVGSLTVIRVEQLSRVEWCQVVMGKGALFLSSGRSGLGHAQGSTWGSVCLYEGTGSRSTGASGSSKVMGQWEKGCVQPVSDGWVVRIWVWASVLPPGPWVCLNPYIPLVNRQNGLQSVPVSSHVGGGKWGWFRFCKAQASQSWSRFMSDISLEASCWWKSSQLGEEGLNLSGVDECKESDDGKEYFEEEDEVVDSKEEAEEDDDCGTEECGKDNCGDRLRVRVVGFSNGKHSEKW
ncbi:hypothetical protein ARMGADRAFT_1029328 [Armillaria gallica]|uniref:Uncharacterized protein n=1 Tax=Armillaria gallica TaxID=47427 RepID=A0A2H3DVZ2_ARMGA|nr:hypothetical protein ARMGADRAFT_1029328 [Armillaria gallica]